MSLTWSCPVSNLLQIYHPREYFLKPKTIKSKNFWGFSVSVKHSNTKVNIPTTEVITIVYSCPCVVLMALHRSLPSAPQCFKMLILWSSIALSHGLSFSLCLGRSSLDSCSTSQACVLHPLTSLIRLVLKACNWKPFPTVYPMFPTSLALS